jgi:hypothetical protein
LLLNAVEVLDVDGAANVRFPYNEFNRTGPRYDDNTTPPVTVFGCDALVIAGGAQTIDLTAVPLRDTTKDFTGKKVVVALFHNPGSNDITIAKGASNGYELQGAHSLILQPGGFVALDFGDGLTDVAAGAKTLDVTGTADDVLDYFLAAG